MEQSIVLSTRLLSTCHGSRRRSLSAELEAVEARTSSRPGRRAISMFVTNANESEVLESTTAGESSTADGDGSIEEKVGTSPAKVSADTERPLPAVVDFAPSADHIGKHESEATRRDTILTVSHPPEGERTQVPHRANRFSRTFGRLSFLPRHSRQPSVTSDGQPSQHSKSTSHGATEENHPSARLSRFFARFSYVAQSFAGGHSSISSRGQSTSDSYDVENNSYNKRMRKRDSKAIPKSWITLGISGPSLGDAVNNVAYKVRNTNFHDMYEKAKARQQKIKRSRTAQILFQYTFYLLLAACVYLGLVGMPLWRGAVWYMYILFQKHLVLKAGLTITFGIGFLYAYAPLLINFEPTAPLPEAGEDGRTDTRDHDTALIIPCYKSEKLIGQTLEAALKIFPKQNIFVVANGNSPEPLDDTAAVCKEYDVSHTWSPLGSKIIAQFVGCYVARRFSSVLLIDDDCLLPPNLPVVCDRLRGNVKCIGYIMKATGPDGSQGTLCQQAQDLEYKLSGLAKFFAGKVGSVTFPHGAIVLWDRELLIQTFQEHPGFSVSEDWFFGHAARQLGCRITMCTSTFVETEAPSSLFFSSGGARGGFGEMTVWKQRFYRWNYFFVTGMYYDLSYILLNWKLGWREIGAKIFVFQEVYETLLYILAPFIIPISFATRPAFSSYLYAATIVMYIINALIFNHIHLRSRRQTVSWPALLYYIPFKWVLGFVNIASCYYAIYTYATYFAKRHPKIIEDDKAIEIVLQMEHKETFASHKEEVDDLNELMYKIAKPVGAEGGKKRKVVTARMSVCGG
ncbi:MAG: hypothetical protein Q9170_002525 [Blastenia crenularia]